MNRKRVWRYYCDHCGKGGCSASAMAVHERHCTMNPRRVCRVCAAMDQTSRPLADIMTLLPTFDPDLHQQEVCIDDGGEVHTTYTFAWGHEIDAALPAMTEAAGGCPMCVFSALRQHGHDALQSSEFQLEPLLKDVWADVNAAADRY